MSEDWRERTATPAAEHRTGCTCPAKVCVERLARDKATGAFRGRGGRPSASRATAGSCARCGTECWRCGNPRSSSQVRRILAARAATIRAYTVQP